MNTRLTCIMFTDIFGFSQMMETSESETIQILDRHNELVFPIIEAYSGKIVDTVGDGLLVIFDSALSAVECAVKIQTSLGLSNLEVTPEQRFKMRIGLHLGDIWYNGNRVFGNGVNITSRIESQALPGGICISEDLYHQVSNKIRLEFKSIGVVPLKNIERNISLYHIITGYEDEKPAPKILAEDDARRQKLLEAREEIRRDLEKVREKPHSTESAIEVKVLGFVDKVMDKALDKWDKLPEDKKISLSNGSKGKNVTLELNTPNKSRTRKKGKPAADLLPLGIVTAGFGMGIFHFEIAWMWIPFILASIGFLGEVKKLIQSISSSRKELADHQKKNRQLVLKAAASTTGRITPVRIAAKTGLDIDEVQSILDQLTSRGYIIQHLQDNGAISYELLE